MKEDNGAVLQLMARMLGSTDGEQRAVGLVMDREEDCEELGWH